MPFHADLRDLAEALEPAQQSFVTGRCRLEGLRTEQTSERVECGGNVDVQVSVDATGHGAPSFYDGHAIPSFLRVEGWHGRPRSE